MILLTMMALDQADYSPEVWAEIEKLRAMDIPDETIEELMGSVQETVEVMEAIEELDGRLAEMERALAARPEVAACEAEAAKRLGAPVQGTLTVALHDGAFITVTEAGRDGNLDDEMALCVIGVVNGLKLIPDPEHPNAGKTVPMVFGAS